jgi:hypothetical protein
MPEIVISGSVICLGSLLFLIAALSPSSRVFGAPDPEKKLAIIYASPRGWRISQMLFGVGALVVALGVGILAHSLRWLTGSLLYLPAALLLAGAIAWGWHVYLRYIDPESFVHGELPGWHFVLYTLLTLAAFFLLGFELLRLLGVGTWLPWLLMGGSLVLFIVYLVIKDLPPLLYYLLGIVLGISLILAGRGIFLFYNLV